MEIDKKNQLKFQFSCFAPVTPHKKLSTDWKKLRSTKNSTNKK